MKRLKALCLIAPFIFACAQGQGQGGVAATNGASALQAVGGVPSGVYDVRAYGATGDGVTDDSAAINAAIADALAGCGGEVLFPLGRYRIESSLNVWPATPGVLGCMIEFRGYGSASQILVDTASRNQPGLYAGNMGHLLIDGLTFVTGSPFDPGSTTAVTAPRVDSLDTILVTGSDKVTIRWCLFLGLQSAFNSSAPSTYATVEIQGASATVQDNQFLGCAGGPALQVKNWTGALVIERNQFLDYGNLNGIYYSKTPNGEVAWIGVGDQYGGTLSGASSLPLVIRDVGFDEGAKPVVFFPSSPSARWDRVLLQDLNVYGATGDDIFVLPQIDHATVTNIGVNVRSHNYNLVNAINSGSVYIQHVSVDRSQGGTASILADASTKRVVLDDVDVDEISSAAIKTDVR